MNIIRSLNLSKAHGWDGISVTMINLSDAALVLPLKKICFNYLRSGLFSEMRKYANVVPVYKKNEKDLKETIAPFLFFQSLEKYLKRSYITHCTHILIHGSF